MSYFKLKLSNLELHEFLFQNCQLYFTSCQLRLQKLLPPLQYLFCMSTVATLIRRGGWVLSTPLTMKDSKTLEYFSLFSLIIWFSST